MDESLRRPSADSAAEQALILALEERIQAQQVEIRLRDDALRRASECQQAFAKSYAALFDAAPVAVIEVTGVGAVGRCNSSARALLPGLEPGALLTEAGLDERGREQLLTTVVAAQRNGRAAGLLDTGERLQRIEAVSVAGASDTLVFLTDSSENLTARREAERSANQLRAILRSAQDGVALLYRRQVLYANDAWRELTDSRDAPEGWLLDEVVEGRSLAARLTELSQEDGNRAIDVRLGEGTAREVLAELTAAAVEYEGKNCVLVMARDLTARRQLEAQIARNERLASLGMLIAGVAHEINNPLTYTLGNLESLSIRVDQNPASLGTEEAREAVRDSIDGCQRIATIIRELRSFYRSDDQQVALLDPNQVVRDAVRIVAPKCSSVARLDMELGEVPAVLGVQTSLVQVLINLIVNAIDAMPERDAADNVVRVSTGCRAHDIRIEVADNGRGIPPEDLSRIFEPFFSRGKATGTGLGLTISRNMVEQMNGWIDVDSRVGTGTRFIVHLEAASRKPNARSSEPPAVPSALIAQARILVVDDEPLVARSVSRLLCSASEVICVHSVTSALDILLARPDIDLVISDWVMPDGGAPALLRGLSARGRDDLPFVVMTGLGQLGPSEPLLAPCVAKPVSRSALLTAVAQALSTMGHRRSMVVRVNPNESAAFPAVDPDTPLPDADATARRQR
jgi:signal transduction histidine kinase/DNA-binding NarL/FixJ family response regulator